MTICHNFICHFVFQSFFTNNITHLEVYRAKDVDKPRSGQNLAPTGDLINPSELLEDLMNSIGKYTNRFRLGLPNSGRSVKIPT